MTRPRAVEGLPPHVAACIEQAFADGAGVSVQRFGAHPPHAVVFTGVPRGSATELRLCGLPEARALSAAVWRWAPASN